MTDEVVDGTGEAQGQEQQAEAPETGGNPNWDSIRSQLDPVSFKLIEPELRKWDESARQRIEKVNSSYEPFKRYADQNITPEALDAGLNLLGQINTEPEKVFEVLQEFLEKEGRLPGKKELQKAVAESEAEDESGTAPQAQQQQPQQDPRLDRAMQFIEQQEQAQQQAAADARVDAEFAAVKQEHPEFTESDLKMIARFTLAGNTGNSNYRVADGVRDFLDMKQSILTAPRPGDSAPSLVSPTGGIPAPSGGEKSWGERSKDEVIDVVANLIAKSNGK